MFDFPEIEYALSSVERKLRIMRYGVFILFKGLLNYSLWKIYRTES